MYDKYNNKIFQYKNDDIFIIFYSSSCKFCLDAIKLLNSNGLTYKGYNIDNIDGGINELLFFLNKQKDLTQYEKNHKTIPIIFYKGLFIGGFVDLKNYINANY